MPGPTEWARREQPFPLVPGKAAEASAWKVLLKALPTLTPNHPETWWSEGLGPCSSYCGFLLDHSLHRGYLFNLGAHHIAHS